MSILSTTTAVEIFFFACWPIVRPICWLYWSRVACDLRHGLANLTALPVSGAVYLMGIHPRQNSNLLLLNPSLQFKHSILQSKLAIIQFEHSIGQFKPWIRQFKLSIRRFEIQFIDSNIQFVDLNIQFVNSNIQFGNSNIQFGNSNIQFVNSVIQRFSSAIQTFFAVWVREKGDKVGARLRIDLFHNGDQIFFRFDADKPY